MLSVRPPQTGLPSMSRTASSGKFLPARGFLRTAIAAFSEVPGKRAP